MPMPIGIVLPFRNRTLGPESLIRVCGITSLFVNRIEPTRVRVTVWEAPYGPPVTTPQLVADHHGGRPPRGRTKGWNSESQRTDTACQDREREVLRPRPLLSACPFPVNSPDRATRPDHDRHADRLRLSP